MEEHLAFLAGLKKLGRSNWRGISRLFVKTRTPTQVSNRICPRKAQDLMSAMFKFGLTVSVIASKTARRSASRVRLGM